MSFISLFLRTVDDYKMIQPYSEPKIPTGGVNITEWKNFAKKQQSEALSKDWFDYFSFREPETGKLKKQPFIKAVVFEFYVGRKLFQVYRGLLLQGAMFFFIIRNKQSQIYCFTLILRVEL